MDTELKELSDMKKRAISILEAADKSQKTNVLNMTVQTEQLKADLTNDELLASADQLIQVLNEIDSLGRQKEAYASKYDSMIKDSVGKAEQLRMLIKDKYDLRMVDCVNVLDNTVGKGFVVRMDTGDVVRERTLTAAERLSKITWGDDDTDND
jgi:hypothetical protein